MDTMKFYCPMCGTPDVIVLSPDRHRSTNIKHDCLSEEDRHDPAKWFKPEAPSLKDSP